MRYITKSHLSLLLLILLLSTAFKASHSVDILSGYGSGVTQDDLLQFGTYKPWLIHGVTEQNPNCNPLSFSMLIVNASNASYTSSQPTDFIYKVNDIQPAGDIDSHVNFLYNNGYDFGLQSVSDPSIPINLTNTFQKANITHVHQEWYSYTQVYPYSQPNATSSGGYVNLVFSALLESYYNNDTRYFQYNPTDGMITIRNSASSFWWPQYLRYVVYQNGVPINIQPGQYGGPVEIYSQVFTGMDRSQIWQVNNLSYDAMQLNGRPYLTFSNNYNNQNDDTSALLFQFRFNVASNISILFYYNSDTPVAQIPSSSFLTSLSTNAINEFQYNFNSTFPSSLYNDTNTYNTAVNALSNLLGGIAYFYGPIYILEIPEQQPAIGFFTATPARNSFPHGFLWDEGFHDLLICRWSTTLCMLTMGSWFSSQIANGWIPREQARGPECENTIPGSFLVQSDLEGNPPTLMISIEYLMSQSNGTDSIAQFLQTNYPFIQSWWNWFYSSQEVDDSNFFIWYGKPFQGGIQYFGSGLDDYPRSDPGLIAKYMLDLQVWEIVFTGQMAYLSLFVGNLTGAGYYSQLLSELIANLDSFIDPSTSLYKDIFENDTLSDSGTLFDYTVTNNDVKLEYSSNLEVNPELEELEVSSRLRELQATTYWSSHVGYVSLFPLMFGLIPDDSVMLNATFNTFDASINGPMWQPWGILSLAKNDSMYTKNSDYWTGPVWINMQYLVCRGLRTYYPANPVAQRLYGQVRDAVIQHVVSQFNSTGYIWENYNETTGNGQGNHPFTGWSTLILLLIDELY